MNSKQRKILELLKKIENVKSPLAAVAELQDMYENERLDEVHDQIYSDLSVRDELIILQAFARWRTNNNHLVK